LFGSGKPQALSCKLAGLIENLVFAAKLLLLAACSLKLAAAAQRPQKNSV
jgi:hypothetical protein